MSERRRYVPLALVSALVSCQCALAAGVDAPPPDLLRGAAAPVAASGPAGPASAAPTPRSVHTPPTAAQPASGAVAPSAAPQTTVVEDRYTRIEEVHERGEIRSIKVQPKGGQPYEILPTDGGRDLSNSHSNSRGAAGQRVWRILTF